MKRHKLETCTEYRTERGVFYNGDCMEGMATFPDKYFDIAIVDPPYGIGISNNPVRQSHISKQWDNTVPKKMYFDELFRISVEQIIWGGNYFDLPSSQCFIIWDKKQPEDFSLAMCEYAWCSKQSPAKIYRYSVFTEKNKIHPTQKPIELYKWLVKNYVKQGQRILDTHVGSASSLIAYEDAGLEYVGYELDADYYKAAVQRIKDHKEQLTMFPVGIE